MPRLPAPPWLWMPPWLWISALLIGGGPAAARAWTSPAPDVVVYCTPAMDLPMHRIAARYTAQNRVPVRIFVASPQALAGLLRHRARADLVAADSATLRTMAESMLVRADSVTALGRDRFVLVARAGAAVPPGATAAQLLGTHPAVLTDPTSAASFDGAAVLRAAVPGASSATWTGVADTPTVIQSVRADPGALGLVHRTEAAAPGLMVAAGLPAPPTPMSAALVSNGQSAKASDLLAFIGGAEASGVLLAAGLEPAS